MKHDDINLKPETGTVARNIYFAESDENLTSILSYFGFALRYNDKCKIQNILYNAIVAFMNP